MKDELKKGELIFNEYWGNYQLKTFPSSTCENESYGTTEIVSFYLKYSN